MYDVHLGLTGKRVVDFLLVLIKFFFARCYGRAAISKTDDRKSAISLQPRQFDPKFQVQGVGRMDGWTDRQTDRQTAFSWLYRVCIPFSAVKTHIPSMLYQFLISSFSVVVRTDTTDADINNICLTSTAC